MTRIPDAETIVLSRATFSGVMPDHPDVSVVTRQAPSAILFQGRVS
ncbi:MAG: hypothetical protein V3U96_07570 [Paracoccaceae bacterium]